MKTTGIVRRLRNFGSFVIPVKLLKYLNIGPDDFVEFFLDEGIGIALRKYELIVYFVVKSIKQAFIRARRSVLNAWKRLKVSDFKSSTFY